MAAHDTGVREAPQHDRSLSARLRTRLGAVLVAQVTRFRTQRPTFADDNLFQQLQSSGVPVNANPPDAGAPVWQQLARDAVSP